MIEIKVVNNKIEIDPYEIMRDLMTGDMRQDLIETLACQKEIIDQVAAQLVDGYTNNGSCGEIYSFLGSALQNARKKIAENSDYAVKKTIEEMDARIKSLEKSLKWYQDNYEVKDLAYKVKNLEERVKWYQDNYEPRQNY